MTTTIKTTKRETLSLFRNKAIILELHPTWLCVRQKGTRTRFTVTYDQVFTLGAKNAAEQVRRERAEAKKARRAG